MNYFDSTIRVGYYHAFNLEFADHTYAMVDRAGERWAFPCFGGVAEHEGDRGYKSVKFPVDMWTPYSFGSRNVGSALPANLYVALGMAQFSAQPKYNFRLGDWDEYWKSRPVADGLASWAGLAYGISGVCQQACNRILWSTCTTAFTECPVNWPPSFSKSYWVYGYWGKTTEGLAILLAQLLVAQAQLMARQGHGMLAEAMGDRLMADSAPAPLAAPAELSSDQLVAEAGREIGAALREGIDRDERKEEIRALVSAAPTGEKVLPDRAANVGVVEIDARFQRTKADLDAQLLRDEVAPGEYATQVNAAFARMVAELRDAMPPETFARLFPDIAAGAEARLVEPALMPGNYAQFQEAARV